MITNALPCKIYGLVKTHKEGMPLRPIVSAIQSPFYNLSKFFGNVLSKIVGKTANTVKNSFEFVEFLKTIDPVPEDYMLASLDIVSMYTNIPISYALEVISKKWDVIKAHTSLPKNEFLYGVKSCLESTVFQYENDFYKQISGLAMGGPISAVVANLVLEDLEEKILNYLPFKLFFYKRFVDDILICCHKNEIDRIFEFFNSFDNDIKFTLEKECQGSINFLDVSVRRYQGKFVTTWFSKPTFSGRYLNFMSVQPFAQKVNVVRNLATRVCLLSHPVFRENCIKVAKRYLEQNCYPITLVNSVFKEVINCCYNGFPSPKPRDDSEFVVLPYIPSVSEKLKASLRPHKISVVNSNKNNLGKFNSSLKARTSKDKISNVVYQVQCRDCPGVYIGQTSQYLHKRMDGHKFNKSEVTALKQHVKNKRHEFNFNFDSVKILCQESNTQVRSNLEGLHILKESNAINSRTEFNQFEDYYVKKETV